MFFSWWWCRFFRIEMEEGWRFLLIWCCSSCLWWSFVEFLWKKDEDGMNSLDDDGKEAWKMVMEKKDGGGKVMVCFSEFRLDNKLAEKVGFAFWLVFPHFIIHTNYIEKWRKGSIQYLWIFHGLSFIYLDSILNYLKWVLIIW